MSKAADCSVRITAVAHKRLKQLAAWANDIPLATAARLAIEDAWIRQWDARKAERKARRAGR